MRQMHVNLGGVQRGVAKPLLELVGADTLLGFGCREGVAQRVTAIIR